MVDTMDTKSDVPYLVLTDVISFLDTKQFKSTLVQPQFVNFSAERLSAHALRKRVSSFLGFVFAALHPAQRWIYLLQMAKCWFPPRVGLF